MKSIMEDKEFGAAVGWWKLAFSRFEGTGKSGSIRGLAIDRSHVGFVRDINSLPVQSF